MRLEELSQDTLEQLERWPPRARRLLDELCEDAGSPLQRELLLRAVGAGHTPAEVHAFADELRALDDAQAFEACTLEDARPQDYTVAQLLRAEADPLFAFELKVGALDPGEDEGPAAHPTPPAGDHTPTPVDTLALGLANKKRGMVAFEAASHEVIRRAPRAKEYVSGTHRPHQPTDAPSARPPTGGHLLEDLINDATRQLGLSWHEHEVDAPGGLKLEDAVSQASFALGRDIPIPCAIGPAPGVSRRFVLLLQLSTSGRARAWQLYDPFSQAVAWVNEADLLARAELPFADKANRRITRIALPSARAHSL